MSTYVRSKPIADLAVLDPRVAHQFQDLAAYLVEQHRMGKTRTMFEPHETYRSPVRQLELLSQKPPVTKVGPFRGPHQFGLAVDYVPKQDGKWSWHADHDYQFLAVAAGRFGLIVPITWDRVHVESPIWPRVRAAIVG